MATYPTLEALPWGERDTYGYRKAEVALAAGETAPNPCSTNHPQFFGPARVVYIDSRDSIRVILDEE